MRRQYGGWVLCHVKLAQPSYVVRPSRQRCSESSARNSPNLVEAPTSAGARDCNACCRPMVRPRCVELTDEQSHTKRSRQPPDDIEWELRHRLYWDKLSSNYDSTYKDSWSTYENRLVQERLTALVSRGTDSLRVVEFGCGTGLGYSLLRNATERQFDYTGIDLSPGMLKTFKARHSGVEDLVNAPLESMSRDQFSNVDLVFAIFTSGSYVDLELPDLLSLLHGWLKPQCGVIYLSFLNRSSLKHIVRWGFRHRIEYASRHTSIGRVPVRRYSRLDLTQACDAFGMKSEVYSLGPFAGVLELPRLREINSVFTKVTALTHTVDVIATRDA